MDVTAFVQNIKHYCDAQGIKPTIACKESGAGKDLINQIETRGSIPSVAKVQMLAEYLGVTTSQLLGETEKSETLSDFGLSEGEELLIQLFRLLPQEEKDAVLRVVQAAAAGQRSPE